MVNVVVKGKRDGTYLNLDIIRRIINRISMKGP